MIPDILSRAVVEYPTRPFVIFPDGSNWSYEELHEIASRAAAGLQSMGVQKGDPVLSWFPNGPDALKVMFGASLIGAVYTPLNTAYRGAILEHIINNSGARILVADPALCPRLETVDVASLEIIVSGPFRAPLLIPASIVIFSADVLSIPSKEFVPPEDPVEPWDEVAIIYTSGTTGPSKGVQSTYIHLYEGVRTAYMGCGVTADDRYLLQVPLFHHGGIIGTYAMAVIGGSIAIVPRFDSSDFWSVVRENQITVCALIGSMAEFLDRRPPTNADADNALRLVYMVPLIERVAEFSQRFDVTVRTMFGMTETSCPLISDPKTAAAGSCGRPRAGVEARGRG